MAQSLRPGLLRFFITISSIIGLLHIYIGVRLLGAFNFTWLQSSLVIGLLFIAYALQLLAWLARFIFSQSKYADLFSWLGMMSMGLFSSLLVLTFLRDIVLIGCSFFLDYSHLHQLHINSEIVVIVLSIVASVVGWINVIRTPDVVRVKIPIKNLAAGLTDFRLVQISDIHIGPTIKGKYLQRIIEKVNRLQPHAVAITGDLVDGSVEKLGKHVALLKNIQASYGSFFVTGNHEYYSGAEEWIGYLKSLDVQVLVNEHQIINHKNAQVVMAGICDYSAHQFIASHAADPEKALAGTENLNALKIMLAHQPRSAEKVAQTDAQVQLSGHTHGGQFWPWNFFVRLQQPYNVGLHQLNNLWIYINRGTGYWGPPKRLGKRSEISLIEFVAA